MIVMTIDDNTRRDLIEVLKDYESLLADEGAGQSYKDKAKDLRWRLEHELKNKDKIKKKLKVFHKASKGSI